MSGFTPARAKRSVGVAISTDVSVRSEKALLDKIYSAARD